MQPNGRLDEADDDLKVLIRNATAKWRTAGRTSKALGERQTERESEIE